MSFDGQIEIQFLTQFQTSTLLQNFRAFFYNVGYTDVTPKLSRGTEQTNSE